MAASSFSSSALRPETEQETLTGFLAKNRLSAHEVALRGQGFVEPTDLFSLTAEELNEVARIVEMNTRDRMALLRLAAPVVPPASLVPITAVEFEQLRRFGEFNSIITGELQSWTSVRDDTERLGAELKQQIRTELSAAVQKYQQQADGFCQQVDQAVAEIIWACQKSIERLDHVAAASAASEERCQQACREATSFSAVRQREAEIMSATDDLYTKTKIPSMIEKTSELEIGLKFPDAEFSLQLAHLVARDRSFVKGAPNWTFNYGMNTSHLTFDHETCIVTKSGATGHPNSTVLGSQPLREGVIHSWKVKIITDPVNGTHWYCLGVTRNNSATCSYGDCTGITSNEQVYAKNGTSSTPISAIKRGWAAGDILSFSLNLIDRTFRIRSERSGLEHVFTAMSPGVFYPFFHFYTQGNSLQLIEVDGVPCLPS